MLRYVYVVALVSCAVWSPAAVGQPKVAVVNVPRASEQYQKTTDLEARFDALRSELNKQRDDLQSRVDRTGRSLQEELKPGTNEYRARRKELAMLEAELQYFMESEGKGIEAGLARSLRTIYDDIHAMVQKVAQEKGFDVVLAVDELPTEVPDSPNALRQQIMLQKVLYWNPRIDMTAEVVARLNSQYQAAGGMNSLGMGRPPLPPQHLARRADAPANITNP